MILSVHRTSVFLQKCWKMEAFLNKKYKLVKKDEYFGKFLSLLGTFQVTFPIAKFDPRLAGFSWLEIRLAMTIPTTVELTRSDDGYYHLLTDVKFYTRDQMFKPGIEIMQKSVEGRLVKNVFRINGNKLIETQFSDKTVTIIRIFSDETLLTTLACENVKTKTFCERQQK